MCERRDDVNAEMISVNAEVMLEQYADAEMISVSVNAEVMSEQYANVEMMVMQCINAEVVFKCRRDSDVMKC